MFNQASEQVGELAGAVAAAQAKMKPPAFDSENPAFHSKFASLAAIRNVVIPAYAAEGVAVIQNLSLTDVGVACETVLVHKSGQYMRFGPLVVPVAKRDAWSVAGAATYAKRISLQAVAVIVGDADDDGTTAQSDKAPVKAWTAKDTRDANRYREAIMKAVEKDDDAEIRRLYAEMEQDHEFVIAVYGNLPKPVKSAVDRAVAKPIADVPEWGGAA